MTDVSSDSTPRLPRGVRLRRDEVRDQWLLLAPERVLHPDAIAVAVLERCDGVRTVTEIVDD
ncbi:MAG: pyrroloquinoline quinone biosynthesis peptide chaperone PqqD, partial [Hansschlegelia sp.]